MTIKHLSVEYDRKNERGTFSPGEIISGRVTVVSSSDTKVQRLLVTAKGKAEVKWYEQDGQSQLIHSDKKTYFYYECILLQDKKGDGSEIIGAGKNVYSFTFEIPNREMPSSYKGKWGKITYSLQAKLTKSIWQVHKARTEFPFLTKSEFPFVSKSEMIIVQLKEAQYGTRISFCGSGKVTMHVTSGKMGVKQGETVEVSAEVANNSAYPVTPTFYLCEKQTFVAQSKRIVHTNDILFATGGAVPAASSQIITRALSLPAHLLPTFLNCPMMRLEYSIKVTLDVPLARNSEIKLPLITLLGSPKPPEQEQKKRSTWPR
ncbi:arrestin domain-containing protein 3-like [Lampris incognitus]|uniref:arrestin domain-containing protein 3-like n=1 Tax=Lampris incognitus TaxID=2546036 RepID=UPI0024B4AE37|nr:arrestin domain-containing protein 3-like [Lampris incognitus]